MNLKLAIFFLIYTLFKITQKITKMLKQKSYGVKVEVISSLVNTKLACSWIVHKNFIYQVLDIFLALKLKEIHLVEEKNSKMKHKDKMKLSRADRKVTLTKKFLKTRKKNIINILF